MSKMWEAGSRIVTFCGRDMLRAVRKMSVGEARSLVQILDAYELEPIWPPANLYRSIWMGSEGGYVVYRHCFADTCNMIDGVRAHRQAVFVDEISALDYCRYRNTLIDRNGTDAIA